MTPSRNTVPSPLLSNINAELPALARAMKLQQQASSVGFDWNDPRAVLNKIREETNEIEAELNHGNSTQISEEIGDLMFALVNLARHVGADPEAALRSANVKFERRFAYIERTLAERGIALGDSSLKDMDQLWNEAKLKEGVE